MRSPEKSREQLLRELEKLREKLPPYEYALASARLLKQLEKPVRPRYAIT